MIRCASRVRTTLAAATCAVPLAAWAATGAPDTQLWTELDVTGPLATNTTITGVARFRFSESLPNRFGNPVNRITRLLVEQNDLLGKTSG